MPEWGISRVVITGSSENSFTCLNPAQMTRSLHKTTLHKWWCPLEPSKPTYYGKKLYLWVLCCCWGLLTNFQALSVTNDGSSRAAQCVCLAVFQEWKRVLKIETAWRCLRSTNKLAPCYQTKPHIRFGFILWPISDITVVVQMTGNNRLALLC